MDEAFNQIVESILAANSLDSAVFKSTVDGLPLPIDHPLSEDNPKNIAARRRREEKLKAKQLEDAEGGGGGAGPSGLSEDGQMVDQDGRSVEGGASHSMDDGHPSAADLATSTSLDGGPQTTEFGQVSGGVGGSGADVVDDHQFIAESAYTHGHDLTEEDYHHVHHPHDLQHDDPHGHLHPHQDHHHQVVAHPHEFDEGGHHLAHEEPLGEFTHLDHHHQLHHHQLHHQLQHEDESHVDGLVGATNGGGSGGGPTSELDGNIIAQVMASYNAGSTSAGSSSGLAGGPDSLSANILRALGRGPSSNLVGGGGPTSGQSTSAATAPAGVGGLDPTIDPSLDAAGSEPTSTSAFGGSAGLTGGPPLAGGRLGSLDAGPSREGGVGGGPVRTMRHSSGPARRKNPGGGGTPYGRPSMTVGSNSTALADGRALREGSMSSTGAGGGSGGQRGPRKCKRCVPLDPDGAAACPGRFVRANCDLNKRIEEGRSAVSLSAAAAAGGGAGGGGGWEEGEEGGMFDVSHAEVDEVDLADVDGSSVAGGARPSTSTQHVGSPLTPGGSHAAGSINTANGRSSTPSGGGLQQQHPNLLAPLPPVSGLPERKPRHCKVCVFHGREGRDCPGRGDRRKCASFKEGEDRDGLYGRAVRRSVGGGGLQQGGPSSSGGFDDDEDQVGLPSVMDQQQTSDSEASRNRQQQMQDVDSGLPPLQVGEPAGVEEDEMDYVGGPSVAGGVGGGVGGQDVEDGMLEMVDPAQYVADGEDMAE